MGWISIYWAAPIVAWLVAQIFKVLIAFVKGENKGVVTTFMASGNMPSSHSAIVVALLVAIAFRDGVQSAVFGIAFVVTAIVIYDAMNVRRAVGEQGVVLKEITENRKQFYTSLGHKPIEVAAGILIGAAVSAGMLQIL